MKKLIILSLLLAFLASCQKKYDDGLSVQHSKNIEELAISPDFNWKLTRTITIEGKFLTGKPIVNVTSLDNKVTYYKGSADGKDVTVVLPAWVEDVNVNNIALSSLTGQKNISSMKQTEAISYNFVNNFTHEPTVQFEVVKLTDNSFVIFYTSNYQIPCAIVANLNGNNITYGPRTQIATSGTTHLFPRMLKINDNILLVAFVERNVGYRIKLVSISINGNNINTANTVTLSTSSPNLNMDYMGDNFVALAYLAGSSSVKTRLIEVSPTGQIAIGNEANVSSVSGIYYYYRLDVCALDENHYIVGSYKNPNYTLGAKVVTRSGNSITVGSDNLISPDHITSPILSSDIIYIDNDRALFVYQKNTGTHCRFGDISGSQITFAEENQMSPAKLTNLAGCMINEHELHFAYAGTDGNAQFQTANIAGNAISFNTAFNTGIYQRFCWAWEYFPIPNFLMPNDKILCFVTNINGNRRGMTYMGNYEPPVTDADGDGIPDDQDDYPNDPLRAFDNYFPAAGFGSLAYEDLWPGMGDYDFNDLVVDYRFQTVTNALNQVVEIFGTFTAKASGAYLQNGFGFNLPNANAALTTNPQKISVNGYDVRENYITLNAYGHETGQSKPTIIVFDKIFNLLSPTGGGIGVNTDPDYPFVNYDTVNISIIPNELYPIDYYSLNTWNPFIIVDKVRGHEVHLPDYEPTDLADNSLFNQWEDDSNPLIDRYYKTVTNLPWALDIPAEFEWPKEKIQITEAYHRFADWAESEGSLFTDWYTNTQGYRDQSKLYPLPE